MFIRLYFKSSNYAFNASGDRQADNKRLDITDKDTDRIGRQSLPLELNWVQIVSDSVPERIF